MIKASAAITLSCVVDVSATWRYYLLQSSTLTKPDKPAAFPPPSAWTDAEPDYTPGSTNSLYVVDLTEFSDGTWSYSAVSLSSAYEAAKQAWNKAQAAQDAAEAVEEELSAQVNILEGKIELRATKTEVEQVQTNLDNLQVGGVNLIRGTRALELNDDVFGIQGDVQPSELFRGCYTLKTDAAWSGYKIDLAALAERKDLKVGDILTYSIWTKFDATPIKAPSFSLFMIPVISGINGALVTPIVSTLEEWQNWRRLEYTFTVTEEFLSVTSLRLSLIHI